MKMKLAVLLAIPPPPTLDEIILKIVMHTKISNGIVGVYKACNLIFSSLHTHGTSHQVIEGVLNILAMLVLSDRSYA
jgi:hypothetical protein